MKNMVIRKFFLKILIFERWFIELLIFFVDGDDNSRQASATKRKTEVVEDEFNIEPLKPTEKVQEVLTDDKKVNEKKSNESDISHVAVQVIFFW